MKQPLPDGSKMKFSIAPVFIELSFPVYPQKKMKEKSTRRKNTFFKS